MLKKWNGVRCDQRPLQNDESFSKFTYCHSATAETHTRNRFLMAIQFSFNNCVEGHKHTHTHTPGEREREAKILNYFLLLLYKLAVRQQTYILKIEINKYVNNDLGFDAITMPIGNNASYMCIGISAWCVWVCAAVEKKRGEKRKENHLQNEWIGPIKLKPCQNGWTHFHYGTENVFFQWFLVSVKYLQFSIFYSTNTFDGNVCASIAITITFICHFQKYFLAKHNSSIALLLYFCLTETIGNTYHSVLSSIRLQDARFDICKWNGENEKNRFTLKFNFWLIFPFQHREKTQRKNSSTFEYCANIFWS